MDLLGLAIVVGVILIATVLHETMHGVAAYFLGDTTAKDEGRLSLNPLNHIDPMLSIFVPIVLYLMNGPVFAGAKPVPVDTRNLKFKEWGMALVAIAGPITNLVLSFVGFLIGYLTHTLVVQDGNLFSVGGWGLFWAQMVMVNLGFFVFNMIPFPPLDGSRILYAIAPDGVRRVMMYLERVGVWLVLLLVVVLGSALSHFMSWAISGVLSGFFLVIGAA